MAEDLTEKIGGKSLPKIRGLGHEILACFDIEYEHYIKELVEELMEFPNSNFTLTLKRKKP